MRTISLLLCFVLTNTIAYTADHEKDLELNMDGISGQQEDNCIPVDLSRFSQYLPSVCPDDCKIRDNEILCLRIWAQSENPPIFTYKIQKKLRHIDQKTCRSFVERNLNIISYSGCILLGGAVALSGNILGTILDCANVTSFLIDNKTVVDYDSFLEYRDCQSTNQIIINSIQLASGIGVIAMAITGQGIYSYFQERYEKGRNDIQDGLRELDQLYLGIAKALLGEYLIKLAIIKDRKHLIDDLKNLKDNNLAEWLCRSSAEEKDRIFGEVIGKKLSRLSFKNMENVIENLQKIRSALPKKTNHGRALFPLSEVAILLDKNSDANRTLLLFVFADEDRAYLLSKVFKHMGNEELKAIVKQTN